MPAPWPGGGMDDDARRLVDDQEILVLVGDPQPDVLRLERPRLLGRLELDLLAAGQPGALCRRGAVHEHLPRCEQALRLCAGANLRQPSEEAVEPETGGCFRNLDANRIHLWPVRSARRTRT